MVGAELQHREAGVLGIGAHIVITGGVEQGQVPQSDPAVAGCNEGAVVLLHPPAVLCQGYGRQLLPVAPALTTCRAVQGPGHPLPGHPTS